jgi:hypothetical protein
MSKKKIEQDPDFINCARVKNSLKKYLSKYSDGVSDEEIAKLLMISEEEVKERFNNIILKLRKEMKIDSDE